MIIQEKILNSLQQFDFVSYKFNCKVPLLPKKPSKEKYVYFLINDGRVVYVGITYNIKKRFRDHGYHNKKWTSCNIICCPLATIKYKPAYNRKMVYMLLHEVIEQMYIRLYDTNQHRLNKFNEIFNNDISLIKACDGISFRM